VAPDCGDSVEARLSNRELEVFRLTGSGFKTRQIAAELNLSAKTIETYKTNIKNKLNLANSRELLQHAIEWARPAQP
jgi:DNA-binding NarL/FixJ family response regulator